MGDLLELNVTNVAGKEVGSFKMSSSATVLELKQQIAKSDGPAVAFQSLQLGTDILRDDQVLRAVSSASPIPVSVVTRLPEYDEQFKFEVSWKMLDGSGELLEDLQVTGKPIDEEKTWPFQVPSQGIFCVGLDPDSGLLLATQGEDEYREIFETDCVERLLVIPVSDSAYEKHAVEKRPSKGKGKHPDPEEKSLKLVSSDSAYEVPVQYDSPLKHAVEIHVMQGNSCSSMVEQRLNLALALVEQKQELPSKGKGKGKGKGKHANLEEKSLKLVSFEFCPGYLSESPASAMEFETACLDRSALRALGAAKLSNGKRSVMTFPLGQGPDKATELFCLSDLVKSAGKRVTSIAWAASKQSVLITVEGSHAIFVIARSQDNDEWHLAAVIGDEKKRGSQDGCRADVRFWFPCSDERTQHDPMPLVPGPANTIFVYSGGVMMHLADDLESATKIASMRQELWMTEADEGTPEFPYVTRVWGIHQNKIYRTLECRDYTHAKPIRRLQSSVMLRQPRSEIRKSAPGLWPKLDESGRLVEEDDFSTANFPMHHNEENRDTWDGDVRWIWDECLWEGMDTGTDMVKGIGAVILGADGSIWGTVVADEGHVWKLDSGRVAKKATEGSKWRWAEGGVEDTADGSAWGKGEAEGAQWWWSDDNWADAAAWEDAGAWGSWSSWNGGWQESHGSTAAASGSGKGRRKQGK